MNSTPPNVILLHGNDDFAIGEYLAARRAELGNPETAQLNLAILDARTTSIEELRALCATAPFLAERRLVMIEELSLDGKHASRVLAADLPDYIEEAPPFTTLLLRVIGKVPRNSRLLKAVLRLAGGAVLNFDAPEGPELVQWIQTRARMAGGEFSPDGAHVLGMAVGSQPRVLAHEVDKLLAYVNWERPVGPQDVEQLTPAASHANIFRLVDAVGERSGKRAMSELRRLLDQPGQEPMSVFAMIVRQFRLLIQATEMLASGKRAGDVAATLHVPAFVAQKIAFQSRRYSLAQLEYIYRRLLQLDLEMKSGANHETVLSVLVVGLTS